MPPNLPSGTLFVCEVDKLEPRQQGIPIPRFLGGEGVVGLMGVKIGHINMDMGGTQERTLLHFLYLSAMRYGYRYSNGCRCAGPGESKYACHPGRLLSSVPT
jgi:hypothetical protein